MQQLSFNWDLERGCWLYDSLTETIAIYPEGKYHNNYWLWIEEKNDTTIVGSGQLYQSMHEVQNRLEPRLIKFRDPQEVGWLC